MMLSSSEQSNNQGGAGPIDPQALEEDPPQHHDHASSSDGAVSSSAVETNPQEDVEGNSLAAAAGVVTQERNSNPVPAAALNADPRRYPVLEASLESHRVPIVVATSSSFSPRAEAAHHYPPPHEEEESEDSILISVLREQFRNSIIRMPFVPAVVTGRERTVELSLEPQIPIAVAGRRLVARHGASPGTASSRLTPWAEGSETGVEAVPEMARRNQPHPSKSSATAAGGGGLPLKQFNELRQQGFPQGLALEVGASCAGFPVRFWSIDNSTGMDSDQNSIKLVKFHPDRGRTTIERCTRWKELQGATEEHIRLAGLMGVSSMFCLRNGKTGQRKFSVADPTSNSVSIDVKKAVQAIQEAPALGHTPLKSHMREFTDRAKLLASTLQKQNQKVVCILTVGDFPADDKGQVSERTKQEFLKDLAELGKLPVWIFIRLCTDDKNVADFYHHLIHTGLPLVVIDDFLTEATKIHEHNPWLNYAMCLHRSREMGFHDHVLSDLPRRPLDKDELRKLLVILFGKKALLTAPDIHTEWKQFYKFMSTLNDQEGKHWNARTKKVESWIDLRKLDKTYSDGGRVKSGRAGTRFGGWTRRGGASSSPLPPSEPPLKPTSSLLEF